MVGSSLFGVFSLLFGSGCVLENKLSFLFSMILSLQIWVGDLN